MTVKLSGGWEKGGVAEGWWGGIGEEGEGGGGAGRGTKSAQGVFFWVVGGGGGGCLTHAVTGLNIDLTSRPYF